MLESWLKAELAWIPYILCFSFLIYQVEITNRQTQYLPYYCINKQQLVFPPAQYPNILFIALGTGSWEGSLLPVLEGLCRGWVVKVGCFNRCIEVFHIHTICFGLWRVYLWNGCQGKFQKGLPLSWSFKRFFRSPKKSLEVEKVMLKRGGVGRWGQLGQLSFPLWHYLCDLPLLPYRNGVPCGAHDYVLAFAVMLKVLPVKLGVPSPSVQKRVWQPLAQPSQDGIA